MKVHQEVHCLRIHTKWKYLGKCRGVTRDQPKNSTDGPPKVMKKLGCKFDTQWGTKGEHEVKGLPDPIILRTQAHGKGGGKREVGG